MVRLWLAALVAGVCATDQSVRDSAAPPNDHTEQTSAWSHTPSTNAGVCIGQRRDSAMRAVHCGGGHGDHIKRTVAHAAVTRAGGPQTGLDKLKASLKKLRAGRRVKSNTEAGAPMAAKDSGGDKALQHATGARLVEATTLVGAEDNDGVLDIDVDDVEDGDEDKADAVDHTAHGMALLHAEKRGHVAEVARLIDAGASLDARDRLDGNAVSPGALYAAQRYGHLGYLYTGPLRRWSDSELWLEARMTSLIKAGVSVDAKDNDGKTVLMHVAKRGNVDVVARLIKAGESVDAKDPAGNTARYFPTIVYKRMLASLDSASILVSDFVHRHLQTLLSTTSIAALLEFLRLHFHWSAILDTALDRASATHVVVALNLLQFLPFQGLMLPVNLLHEARAVLLSLIFFRGARDVFLRTLRAYREDGKRAAAKTALNGAISVMKVFALILIVWCMALFVIICLMWVGQLTLLLLGRYEMRLEYATAASSTISGMVFLLLVPFHRQEITDWALGSRTAMRSIRRRLFRRPVPIRPPSADDVCPICLDAFLPDLAPVLCDRAPDAHGLSQFAASRRLTSERAPALSMGIQDDRPGQAIASCIAFAVGAAANLSTSNACVFGQTTTATNA